MELNFSRKEIENAAKKFWLEAGAHKVFAFHGEMGAGKTTLIHSICLAKNVEDTISSPTFSIINEYLFPEGTIYHIDLYRLKDDTEAMQAGVEDCLNSGNYCFVEWPERAPGIFPEDTLHVYLKLIDSDTRTLRIARK